MGNYLYSLTFIVFLLASCEKTFAQDSKEDTDIYTIVEIPPRYQGGEEAMLNFFRSNIVYPDSAKLANIEGLVYVTFVVSKDGSVQNIRVLRGFGWGFDKEALRVVGLMPKWSPGTQRGEARNVQLNLPVRFQLENVKKKKRKRK